MHIAVRPVIRDKSVPSTYFNETLRIHSRKPIVGEELNRPRIVFVIRFLCLPDRFHCSHIQTLVWLAVFPRLGHYIHMPPEVEIQVVVDRLRKVEVL